ncbi:MAG: VanZ family protein [Bacteroidales bacterium]
MKLKNYWKTLLIAALILTASILSGKQLNKVSVFEIKNLDKIIHFMMYFILVLSMFSSYLKDKKYITNPIKLIVIVMAIAYGLTLEGVQYYFTVDRSAEIADMIANTIGCIAGLALYPTLFRFRIFRLL